MNLPETKNLLLRPDAGVLHLTLNRPEQRNAMNRGMVEEINAVFDAVREARELRVVVMRGAGQRAFISGADISSFAKTRANADAAERARATSDKLRHAMLHMEKPLIAMIRGYCLGGGLGMALNADIRFASSDSLFSIPAAHRGVAYALDGLKQLVDVVGPSPDFSHIVGASGL